MHIHMKHFTNKKEFIVDNLKELLVWQLIQVDSFRDIGVLNRHYMEM